MLPDFTTQLLDERYFNSVEDMATDWEDEAAEAAVNGNPRRSWYLGHIANRARAMAGQKLGEAKQRIERERRYESASSSTASTTLVQGSVLRTSRTR